MAAVPTAQRHGVPRATLVLLAVAYTAFAIYGSWVPLYFRYIPFDQALERFQQTGWLNIGAGHRADWVANILLFVPLSFFWLGALWLRQGLVRLLASAVVWAGAAALAVAIEFSQVYFPGRTISRNDIAAEMIGAAIGVVLWWAAGERALAWIAAVRRERKPAGALERILIFYAAVVVAYALLPLDLTISVTELYGKWKRGLINVVPFTFREARGVDSIYSMLSEVILWAPMGVLAARRWSLGVARAGAVVALAALGLEVLQLFVWSRMSDVNDVIAALAGGLFGAIFAARAGWSGGAAGAASPLPVGLVTTAILVVAWSAGAALVFLYPFDFNFDDRFIRQQIARVPRVMFASYYWGSEYNAVTQVMRKMLYFLPLGAILRWGSETWQSPVAWAFHVVGSTVFVIGAACAIELAQLGLPGKIVDPTDAALAVTGALVGWLCVGWITGLARR